MSQYFTGVIKEFANIRWLTVKRTIQLTIFMIIVTLILAFWLGAVDSLFASALKNIVV